ncbi:hypothetical protein [Nocardioides stalactiti]|uniref:hypothetical protein n=1 Tax=Nocardioides stalactiti TaxID=2755356 RepID=UPI0016007770|nr:hypothetical protein [Nocardioides stalactiti]
MQRAGFVSIGLVAGITLASTATGCVSDRAETDHVVASDTAAPPREISPAPLPSSAFRRYDESANEWDIERFTSMTQLLSRSDAVFVGTVTGGHWGTEYRESEPDSPEDVDILRDLVFEIRVDRRIRGNSVLGGSGTVEVVIDLYDPREMKLDPPVGEQAVAAVGQGHRTARGAGRDVTEPPAQRPRRRLLKLVAETA